MYIRPNKMKKVKFIVLILASLFSTIFAHTYVSSDPGDASGYDALAAGVTLAAGEIALVAADGSALEPVACSAAALLKAALEADTSASGASAALKAGSCCINAHHGVCQKMQDQIRSCAHPGKGDDALSADTNVCPQ